MESVGQKLKAAREARNMTVSEVAAITKISVQSIKDIDDDKIAKNYAPVYAKGFIKLYAEAVGLSPTEVVDQFLKTRQASRKTDNEQKERKPGFGVKIAAAGRRAGKAVASLLEQVKNIKLRAALPEESTSGVTETAELSFAEKVKALIVVPAFVKRAWKNILAGLLLVVVAALVVFGLRECSARRLTDQSLKYEIIQEPPSPYIE